MKNSNYTTWNRTSDLPICSTVPYPLSHRGLPFSNDLALQIYEERVQSFENEEHCHSVNHRQSSTHCNDLPLPAQLYQNSPCYPMVSQASQSSPVAGSSSSSLSPYYCLSPTSLPPSEALASKWSFIFLRSEIPSEIYPKLYPPPF
jgi:hypothetical protein